jgi:catechol 2,3-dioxygenase-like lactoylglutathione lyase family enzyme
MKRFHVHVNVQDLDQSIRFYAQLFGAEPSVRKDDYAKWMLDDPRLNFAISRRDRGVGVDHLGLQAEDPAELQQIGARLRAAEAVSLAETGTTCCYAQSDKYWSEDPQGLRWESFYTHGAATSYYAPAAEAACCAPAAEPAQTAKASCCGPAAAADKRCG